MIFFNKKLFPTIIIAALSYVPSAAALTFKTGQEHFLFRAKYLQKNIGKLSLTHSLTASNQIFSLTDRQDSSEFLINNLQKMGLAQHFSLRSKTATLSPLRFYGGINSLQERFFITAGGIPLCDFQVALHTLSDGSSALMGEIPTSELSAIKSRVFSNSEAALVLQRYLGKKYLIHDQKACYLVDAKGQLEFVWNFVFTLDDLAHRALVSFNKVERLVPMSFDINGEIEALVHNPVDGVMKTFNIELSESGKLVSEFFQAVSSSGENAYSATNQFSYELDDPHFEEAQTFTHAHTMLTWFEGLGYEWVGPKPLKIFVHARAQGTPNNALYQPAVNSSGYPQIMVGDGDGNILQNLGKDNDVFSHEFSHHILFRTLTNTTGESLVLHEGLADLFTFMQTGNACLGESICPSGSSACWLPDRCLRSAENDLSYLDTTYRSWISAPHLRGQLISAVLWDLAQELNFTKVAQLTFTASSYFLEDSGLQDFVLALFLADRQLNAGENACTIYEKLNARGFESFLANIDCLNLTSIAPITGRSGAVATPAPQQQSSSNNGSFCGFSSNRSSSKNYYLLFLLLLPPIFIVSNSGTLNRSTKKAISNN